MSKKWTWNVIHHNFNSDKIENYDLFYHRTFADYIKKHRKKFKTTNDKIGFAERLKREMMYYFWSKCEWEVIITKKNDRIVITPWIVRNEDVVLDVTDDTSFDWKGFYDVMVSRKGYQNGSVKIDVYDQVEYQWDEFVEYCWNH